MDSRPWIGSCMHACMYVCMYVHLTLGMQFKVKIAYSKIARAASKSLPCFHFLAAASHESRPMSTLLIYNIILHTAAILVYSCPIGRYRGQ